MDTATLARVLIIGGIALVVTGMIVLGLARAGWDEVPGDAAIEVGGIRIHLLLGLSIVLSVIGTIVLNVLWRR